MEIKYSASEKTGYELSTIGSLNPPHNNVRGIFKYKNNLSVLDYNNSNSLIVSNYDVSTLTKTDVSYSYYLPRYGAIYNEATDRIYGVYYTGGTMGNLYLRVMNPNDPQSASWNTNYQSGDYYDNFEFYMCNNKMYHTIAGKRLYYDDLVAGSSTQLTTFTNKGAGTVVGNKIYLIGNDTKITIYDTINNTTEEKDVLPYIIQTTGFLDTAISAIGTDIYIFSPKVNNAYTKDIVKYDTLKNTCEILSLKSNINDYTRKAITIGDEIYIYANKGVYKFTASWNIIGGNGELYLGNGDGSPKAYLINNDSIKQEINHAKYYYGDNNGRSKSAPVYYHNGTSWVEFT